MTTDHTNALANPRLSEIATEIRTEIDAAGNSFSSIGELLATAKALAGDGFGDWLRVEFDWSEQLATKLMGYRNNRDKRVVAEAFLLAHPEHSNRRIGDRLGMSKDTIATVRKGMEAGGEFSHQSTHTDKRGRAQPATKPKPAKPAQTAPVSADDEPPLPLDLSVAPQPPAPARHAGVTVDSGPIEPTRPLRYIPQKQWSELIELRKYFLKRNLGRDCRCLVRFVAEAETMHEALGYDTAEALIRDGLAIAPDDIAIALDWLRRHEPETEIPEAVLRYVRPAPVAAQPKPKPATTHKPAKKRPTGKPKPRTPQRKNPGLRRAFQKASVAAIAACTGISANAVYLWEKIPRKHLAAVAELTGLAPNQLRPDLDPADSPA